MGMWIMPKDGVSLSDVTSQDPLVRQSDGRSSGSISWRLSMKVSKAFPLVRSQST